MNTHTQSHRSRWTLVLLICIFVTPLLLATFFYYFRFPFRKTTNQGQLLKPPLLLSTLSWDPQSKNKNASQPKGKWLLVLVNQPPCDRACLTALHQLIQIRRASGKNQHRIQLGLLWLTTQGHHTTNAISNATPNSTPNTTVTTNITTNNATAHPMDNATNTPTGSNTANTPTANTANDLTDNLTHSPTNNPSIAANRTTLPSFKLAPAWRRQLSYQWQTTPTALTDTLTHARIHNIPSSLTGSVMIVDPRAFVMMYYQPTQPAKSVYKDLNHLLKVSQIG